MVPICTDSGALLVLDYPLPARQEHTRVGGWSGNRAGNRHNPESVLSLMIGTMRKMMTFAVLVTVLAACGAGAEPASVGETTTPSTGPPTTANETTTMPISEQEQLPIVAPARADLARRLGVEPDELEVISAEEVTWPDGSLGCPEPGMSYTQALVDGSKVVLGHNDRVYVYHAGEDGEPFLCPSDEKDGGHEMVPPPGFNS